MSLFDSTQKYIIADSKHHVLIGESLGQTNQQQTLTILTPPLVSIHSAHTLWDKVHTMVNLICYNLQTKLERIYNLYIHISEIFCCSSIVHIIVGHMPDCLLCHVCNEPCDFVEEILKEKFIQKRKPCRPVAPCPATVLHQPVVCGLLPFSEPDTMQPHSHNPLTQAVLNTTITNMGMRPFTACGVKCAMQKKVVTPAD